MKTRPSATVGLENSCAGGWPGMLGGSGVQVQTFFRPAALAGVMAVAAALEEVWLGFSRYIGQSWGPMAWEREPPLPPLPARAPGQGDASDTTAPRTMRAHAREACLRPPTGLRLIPFPILRPIRTRRALTTGTTP